MGSKESWRVLWDMITVRKPDILVLLEPKISGGKADMVCSKLHFDEWVRVECQGLSGGIWLFWKPGVVSLRVISSNPQFLNCCIDYGESKHWFLSLVYGSPNVASRNLLWHALKDFGLVVRK